MNQVIADLDVRTIHPDRGFSPLPSYVRLDSSPGSITKAGGPVRPPRVTEEISECPESECGQGSLHAFDIKQVIVDEFTHILLFRNV